MTARTAIAVAAASTAAATHAFMFVHESVRFDRADTRRMLEVAEPHAAAVRLWAYHQGVYNLLLGATSAVGAVALVIGARTTGRALLVASNGAMTVAAAALVAADRRRERVPGFVAQALPATVCLLALPGRARYAPRP